MSNDVCGWKGVDYYSIAARVVSCRVMNREQK